MTIWLLKDKIDIDGMDEQSEIISAAAQCLRGKFFDKEKTMFTDLSGKWRVCLDGEKRGELPDKYDAEIRLPDTTSHAGLGKLSGERKYGCLTDIYAFEGYAWFGRTVDISEEQSRRELTLYLERTRKTAVYLDGNYVGEYCSLCAPHRYKLGRLAEGAHELVIRVDNTDYPTAGGHLTSQDTQTNWNGITGGIGLIEREEGAAYVESVSVCSDIAERTMRVTAQTAGNGAGTARVRLLDGNGEYGSAEAEYTAGETLECTLKLSENTPTWSEHSPVTLRLEISLGGEVSRFTVGFRQITAEGTKLKLNGRETFLRGKHDGLVFPKTGFAPTDAASWIKVFETAKRYGINHYRFHTCCPPKAAFDAADFMGIYLEPELPFWGTIPDELTAEHEFLREEGFRMLREFGHHPSFVMMSMGNELWGSKERLEELLAGYRAVCPDKLYVQGSNNFQFVPCVLENDDFFSGVRFSRERLIRGSYASCDAPFGHVQTDEPNSAHNYDALIIPAEQPREEGSARDGEIMIQYGTGMKKVSASDSGEMIPNVPVISHEVGQYCIYPNYGEISKYCGSLRHYTYEDYRETARERGLLPYAEDFFRASGALAAACYRDDIETALRSGLMSGFQLLDLQDFPGQGIATVGILDPFMDSKGLIEPSDWRRSCEKTVVLAELKKFVYTAGERIECGLLVSSTDPCFSGARINWTVSVGGTVRASGASALGAAEGRIFRADNIVFSVDCAEPCAAELSLRVDGGGTVNSYRLYIYPEIDVEITESGITRGGKTLPIIRGLPGEGGTETKAALYIPYAEEDGLRGEYCTDFWCYGMFRSISESMGKPVPTGTLGLLIDRESELLRGFPCEKHTTPQWYAIVTHSHCARLPRDIVPDVWVIDNPQRAERLALLYRVGGAVVCTSRLWEIADRVEVKHFAASLFKGIEAQC